MSFVPAVRDYIELINTLYDSTFTDPNIEILIRNTVIYFFETIRYFVTYLVTFQWFRDLCYLPIITPQISLSLIKEKIFLQDPYVLQSQMFTPLLTFLETPALSNNRFLIGFFNSFFASLPISCSALICIYRLMINGIPAAFFSLLGNVLGQTFFLICVLFGLRSFIVPWFSLEPLNYVIGLCLVLNIIFQSLQKRSWKQIQFSEKNRLFSIFLTHFLLIWTEQPSIYQHIGNLTISSDSTILEAWSSNGDINFFISHSFYLFGFVIGSLSFSLLIAIGILKIRSFSLNRFNIRYSVWLNRFHTISILWITTLTFASLPYYGFDYLFTNSLGFVSYDTALEKTIFHAPSFRENLLYQNGDNKPGLVEKQTQSFPDLSSFDKSYYLVSRKPILNDDASVPMDTFEELNYQGEYAWTSRDGRKKTESRRSFLSPTTRNQSDYTKKPSSVKSSLSEAEKNGYNRFSFFSSQNSGKKKDDTRQQTQSSIRQTGSNQNIQLNSQERELKVLKLLSPFSFQNDWLTQVANQQNEEREKINESKGKNVFSNYQVETSRSENVFPHRNEDDPLFDFFYIKSGFGFLPSPSVTGNPMNKQEEKTKNAFYTNPLYRFLLEKDMDAFLSRQPKDHFLSVLEEKQLCQNRSVLNDYYNTLRSYTLLPLWDAFQDEFNGSLSYANKIYNQQFKGTLSLVRRLFSITVNPIGYADNTGETEPAPKTNSYFSKQNTQVGNDRILKLDQPLYKKYIGNSSYFIELENKKKDRFKGRGEVDKNSQNRRNLDQSENVPNLLIHEEAHSSTTKVASEKTGDFNEKETLPLIESTTPIPFYIGWDEKSRKMVITNRLLLSVDPNGQNLIESLKKDSISSAEKSNSEKKEGRFTAWPIPKSILENRKEENSLSATDRRFNFSLPYKALFQLINPVSEGEQVLESENFDTLQEEIKAGKELPANFQFDPNQSSFHKVLSPNRGGFVWPGTYSSTSN